MKVTLRTVRDPPPCYFGSRLTSRSSKDRLLFRDDIVINSSGHALSSYDPKMRGRIVRVRKGQLENQDRTLDSGLDWTGLDLT